LKDDAGRRFNAEGAENWNLKACLEEALIASRLKMD
jgi:nuclear transport factor 2 (NTF2) superfamily protein